MKINIIIRIYLHTVNDKSCFLALFEKLIWWIKNLVIDILAWHKDDFMICHNFLMDICYGYKEILEF